MSVPERLVAALVGRYTIERELGAGGMATVYLAQDVKHRRPVAVKVLRGEIAASLGAERFTREIEVAAKLQHPHILPLLDSGETDGFYYYVMPFVEGESLRDRLARRGELPVADAVRILVEVVDALAHAHAGGVVHRDIKPDNIMISGRHALVTDFGVAKAVSEATGRQTLTSIGVALGTPTYMAPEQAAADPHLDHRVDIYAVGILGYELLTGRPPFTGHSPQEVLAAHMTKPPEPVGKSRPGIPPALEQVLMKCLAKRPADRWQSAEELLAQLEPLATPSGGMTPAGTRPMTAITPVLRRPLVPILTGAVVVALVITGLLLRSRNRAPGTAGSGVPPRADSVPSVGVLPFADLAPKAGQEYFADGLTDEVIVALSKVPGLRVPGRASSFYFQHSKASLSAIAESLHVRTLLTATVQRSGDRVRVRAELVNAADGFQLWSETYDRKVQDLFSVYDDLSRAIAGALQVKLAGATAARSGAGVQRGTSNEAAYDAYLRGNYYLSERQVDSSLPYLERAVALDPTFALAWSELSMAHVLSSPSEYGVRGVSGAAALQAGELAARHALALDSTSAEAHTAAGFVAFDRWQWDEAEREFRRAIALNPSYARARHWHAILLAVRGNFREALPEIQTAETLDPLAWIIGAWVAHIEWLSGDHESAKRQVERVIAIHPRALRPRTDAALYAIREGDFSSAAQRYSEVAAMLYGDSLLAGRWRAGLVDPARRSATAAEMADSLRGFPGRLDIPAYAGNVNHALSLLRKYRLEPGEVDTNIEVYTTNPEVRRTPEFQAAIRRMRLPP